MLTSMVKTIPLTKIAQPIAAFSSKTESICGATLNTVESKDDFDMEIYPVTSKVFGVRAEEPEDDSIEDKAINLAAEYGDSVTKGRIRSCLKIETQKKSIETVYKESRIARAAVISGKSILRNKEDLEGTGHTCISSASESSHTSTGMHEMGQEKVPRTVSGESSSEKAPAQASPAPTNPLPTSPPRPRPVPSKRLAWGRIEIRNYDLTIGENPACLAGAPIQLSWNYDEQLIVVPVDEYETYRPPRRKQRQLFLNREVRDKMLHEYGYKRTDICQAVRKANIDRNNRKTTVMNMKFTWLYELTEGASRKMKKSACGYDEKREIEKLWQKAELIEAKKRQTGS